MKFNPAFLYVLPALLLFSCAMNNKSRHVITQGVEGKVTFIEGNQMPGPGHQSGQAKAVRRKVWVYALATAANADGDGVLFKAVHTPLIATVQTDSTGFFSCRLRPGRYSIFTEEEGGLLFAGSSGEQGELSPIEILPDQVLTYDILINYKAVY